MIDENVVSKIIDSKLKDYAALNKVDQARIEREQTSYLVDNKVDSRNIVDYTFSGTGSESFEHNLGRIPNGRIILNQTQDARIYGDIKTWTSKRVTMRSTIANNHVRFLFL